jgi:hypothetical protein
MIRNLFDEQREILKREINDSHELIAQRVANRVRTQSQEEEIDEVAARSSKPKYALNAVAAVSGALAVIFAVLFWYREDSWQNLQQQNIELKQALEVRRANASQDSFEVQQQLDEYRQSLDETTMVALDSLEWAANQASQYDFADVPLGDFRLSVLQELTNHLVALDFRGVVRIESHVGNFCMRPGRLRTRRSGNAGG